MMMVTAACSMDYPSRTEAESACDKWEASEKKVDYERELLGFEKRTKFEQDNPRPDAAFWDDEIKEWEKQKLAFASESISETISINPRYCQEEEQTSQFLGYQNNEIKNGTYQDEVGKKGEWKVVRHFRY